jgi:hypothetical protein
MMDIGHLPRNPRHEHALRLEELTLHRDVIMFSFERGIQGIFTISQLPHISSLDYLEIELTHHRTGKVQRKCVADPGLCSYDENLGSHQTTTGWPSDDILIDVEEWESLPQLLWQPEVTKESVLSI